MVIRKILTRAMAFFVPILLDAFCMGIKKWYWQNRRDRRFKNYKDAHKLD